MLGSHNSLTYLKSKHKWMEWFSFLWRCQNKDLDTQYKFGVRFFDIRLARNKDGYWSPCHGLVKLNFNNSIRGYIDSIHMAYPDSKIRLLCEKSKDKEYFIEEVNELFNHEYPYLDIVTGIIIKKNWEIIYQPNPIPIEDLTYVPWHSGMSFWENIKHFKFSTIKKWAEKHNPKFTSPEINDYIFNSNSTIIFIDYV